MQINVDLGEGGEFDKFFMSHIHICSIACGGHYGNINTIKKTINTAKLYNVKVGSHPSYPDKINFGRQSYKIKLNEFQDSLFRQLSNFKKALDECSIEWHHCKAHGALYNDITSRNSLSLAYLEVLSEFNDIQNLILPANKEIIQIAESIGFNVIKEVFADRKYNNSLSLISRNNKNAVIESLDDFINNFSNLINGKIFFPDGTYQSLDFDTICLHSDTKNSKKFISIMKNKLNNSS
ncbi:MAG: lactam utilization protein LamB [Flavobacteriaceae bacterium]|nr:lactam utilization protein LamB [Flavobacteriaceae bacterium]